MPPPCAEIGHISKLQCYCAVPRDFIHFGMYYYSIHFTFSLSFFQAGQTVPDAHFSGLIFLTPSPTGMTCPASSLPPAPRPRSIARQALISFRKTLKLAIQLTIGRKGKGEEERDLRNARTGRGREGQQQRQRQHLSRDEVNLLIYQPSKQASGHRANQPRCPSVRCVQGAFPDRKPIHPPSRLTTWLCLMVFRPNRTEGQRAEEKNKRMRRRRGQQHEITSH